MEQRSSDPARRPFKPNLPGRASVIGVVEVARGFFAALRHEYCTNRTMSKRAARRSLPFTTKNSAKGFHYINDADAQPPGSAHPQAHLCDAGAPAVDELNRMVKLRALAL